MKMLSTQLHEALLAERATAAQERVHELTGRMRTLLKRASPYYRRPGAEPTDGDARALAATAKELHGLLDIRAENPVLSKLLKRKLGKLKNFRKMLARYAAVTNLGELEKLVQSQRTKSSDAHEKMRDWSYFALGVIGSLDSEVEGTLKMGPFRVVLVTAERSDWDRDGIERLRAALGSAVQRLNRVGMGGIAQGTVFAYPSYKLPPGASLSHSALASYSPRTDTMNVAIGHESDLEHSLVHELGHRAYFKLAAGRGRSAWSKFFERESGAPKIDAILKRWEAYAGSEPLGRYLSQYLYHLNKSGGGDGDAMWLRLVADNIGVEENFHPLTGRPRGKGAPGLDQFSQKLGKAKVFLHPVTSYSAKSAEELFAETFAEYAMRGPRRVPPIVRIAFQQTLPGFKA